MTDPSGKQPQPENSADGQAACTGSVVHRKISVKGSGGVTAAMVVIAQCGQVWVSIMPPFTWEAIMKPEKVDELIHALGLARDDSKRMVSGKRVSRGDKQQPVGRR